MGKRFRILVDVDLIGLEEGVEDFFRARARAIHVGGRREIGWRFDEPASNAASASVRSCGVFAK